jgi:hypothetical protein
MVLWDWKRCETVVLVSLVILAPWLIALAFGSALSSLTVMAAGILAGALIGIGALAVLGAGLFKST